MPAPSHIRVSFIGVFGTRAVPVEEWSFGVSLGLGTEPIADLADLAEIAQGAESAFTWLQPRIGSNAHLTTIKVSKVAATGKVPKNDAGTYVQVEYPSNLSGGGTANMPLQIALAYSLETAASGPTGRGRFYLPSPVVGVLESDGTMQTGTTEAHANAGASFLDALGDAAVATGYGRVVVASGGSAAKGIAPALHPLVAVNVGDVLDTQRRRRGDLDEKRARVTVQ